MPAVKISGWALGGGEEHGDDPAWVRRMQESMARLTPHFAADRTVREYTEVHYLYSATLAAGRPATDYTARVIPHREGVSIPLEESRILWQR